MDMGRHRKRTAKRNRPGNGPPGRAHERVERESIPNRRREALSVKKKALFSIIVFFLFFLSLEVLLALAGVRSVLYEKDPYVGFASNVPLFIKETSADGPAYMVTAPNKIRWFNNQRFPKEKPEGVYRLFSLGGSTTYGRPYEDPASFSGWLREFLRRADQDRQWQVINAGGISYASYRVSVLMEELIQYNPDLFIVYSGHNEFLERRTYQGILQAPEMLTRVGGALSRTRTYAAFEKVLSSIILPPGTREASRDVLKAEVDTLLEHSVGPTGYTRDDKLQEQIIAHYRFNLNRMIDIARSAGARVILVTPASNLKDISPFKSEHLEGLSSASLERFESLYSEGRKALSDGMLPGALAKFDVAARIDDRYAHLHYQRGLVLFEMGRYGEARTAFRRAIDEDVCPLRILTPMQDVVGEVARARGVPHVDFADSIAQKSEHGITGGDFFLDHVHLNLDGYRMLALELLDVMAREGIVGIDDSWGDDVVASVTQTVEGRIDRRAHGRALRNLAKVFDWAGKQEEAEKLASRAAAILKDDAETYNVLGRAAAARGDTDEAIDHFRKALEAKPGYVAPLTPLGIALGKKGRVDEAVQCFRKAIEGKPDFAEAHYNLGIALMSRGDVDEAIASYRRALEIDPEFAPAYNNLGISLVKSGKLAQGISHYRKALQIRPDYAEPHLNLGMALEAKGKREDAIREYREALRIRPNYAAALSRLSSALRKQGDGAEAGSVYDDSRVDNPDKAQVHYSLGVTLMEEGRVSRAVRYYRQAMELNPESARTHANLGVALLSQGNIDEAVRQFREARELDPDKAETHFNLAAALALQNNTKAAIQYYRQALQLRPDYAEAHSNLGAILLRNDSVREAIRHLREAVRLNPRLVEAHHNLGIALGSQGRFEGALAHFRRAVEIEPGHAKAHYYLGRTLAARGDFRRGLKHLEKAASLAPDSPRFLNQLAWVLATSPDPTVRDGSQAVEVATRAASLTSYEDPIVLDTLAASYAEAGNFEEAAAKAEEALQLYTAAEAHEHAGAIRDRMEHYRQAKPYREGRVRSRSFR